jgi:hypothetical protein
MKRFSIFLLVLTIFSIVLSVAAQDSYTVKTRTARVRAEPNTTSRVVATLRANTVLDVIEAVDGASVSGSIVWYHITVRNGTGYIHSSLVQAPASGALVTSGGGSGGSGSSSSSSEAQPTAAAISTPVPDAPPSFVPNCNGNVYNCSDLTCGQMAIYWNACPGDPSGLDGNDNDGRYCESKCG